MELTDVVIEMFVNAIENPEEAEELKPVPDRHSDVLRASFS